MTNFVIYETIDQHFKPVSYYMVFEDGRTREARWWERVLMFLRIL